MSLEDRTEPHEAAAPFSGEAPREEILEELSQAAIRRYGPERAAALQPVLAALAEDIAKNASFSLTADDRPAFFLREPGPGDGADDATL